ncbi:5'-3' exonuclease family protein [Perilla frutescens var. frutescens]|nr:5'-3' exonuclease family protein [Perilla frutescens var. frutescens]
MGVGGHFWDLLKPYARFEGCDFLRNKRVAVDLSYWVVQHETAIKGYTRNPHIRITFFRTLNLFSKFGAYPVFVLDGTPSPLKSQARIMRFFRSSGIDLSSLPEAEKGVSVERNRAFKKCIEECVELLKLLGMPILKAKGEAEALCAQLNREGHVDACITADSDAFVYGAQCVVKRIQPNSKEPFECYHMSDIETSLGLRRNHLIAVSLLVGSDHDLNGIVGIGLDTAVRFVKGFSEDEILNRLHEVAKGVSLAIQGQYSAGDESGSSCDAKSPKLRLPHCSHCGHPGNKRAHLKFSCEYCNSTAGQSCWNKPVGFKCSCTSCDLDREEKAKKKDASWKLTVCRKIASEQNFPNDEIIQMYLSNHHGIDDKLHVQWASPDTGMLVDYLAYQQNWEPSYIRQRLLPMLSTIYLRDMASCPTSNLLYGLYKFHGIQRVKIRYGHQSYVVKWKKAATSLNDAVHPIPEESDLQSAVDLDESLDLVEDTDGPYIHIDNGDGSLSTDEDMELVQKAFPEEAYQFLKDKELREAKSRKKKLNSGSEVTPEKTESSASRGVQLSITEFYRSSKLRSPSKHEENAEKGCDSSEGKRKDPSSKLSKSLPEMDVNEAISIGILVVNDDLACQNKVAEVLRCRNYQVLHTGTVYDALHAIWENKDRLDLVITNAQKLESEGRAIIQNIEHKLKLNVLLIRSDERIEPKGELFSFSSYVLNGLSINDFNNLLENAKQKEVDEMVAAHQQENVQRASISNAAVETNKAASSIDAAECLNQKRKAVELYGERSEDSKDDHHKEKKQRVTWTNEMHEKFVDAIERLGHDKAVPKKIVEVMGVPGLTRENVASHLQKFRCSMRRNQEPDLSCRSRRIELEGIGSASRLTSFPQSSFIPPIKDASKDVSFSSRLERKFYTRIGGSHLSRVYKLRNMMHCRDKNTSDTSKFVGYRFIGNSIELGPIDKINKGAMFSTLVRSENQSTSYVQHHPISGQNPIGSASCTPQQSSFQWQPVSRSHGAEKAAINTSQEPDLLPENLLQYPQQQITVQQSGDWGDSLHDQNLLQSWDTPTNANAALFHNTSENASTTSSMLLPHHQDSSLPSLETTGNDFAVQFPVALVDDILQQHFSPPPPPLLPQMLQNLDDFFSQSGVDDSLMNGIGNTFDQFDLPEFDDTIFSQDD